MSLAQWEMVLRGEPNLSGLPHERRGVWLPGRPTPNNDPNRNNISDFSKITRENTGLFGVPTTLEASVSHVSHGDFFFREITKTACVGKPLLDRERRKRRFCDQCCGVDVKAKPSEQS